MERMFAGPGADRWSATRRLHALKYALARRSRKSSVTRAQCPGRPWGRSSGGCTEGPAWRTLQQVNAPQNHLLPGGEGERNEFLLLFIQLQSRLKFYEKMRRRRSLGELVRANL